MSGEQKPVCVVLDTNIWYQDSNLLLKTAMGSALLYILKQNGGKIGLPEIIEEELTRNIVEQGIKSARAISKEFKMIEKIMGFRSPYEVPDQAKIEESIRERLIELDDLFHRVEFTLEHAKSALRRVNEKSQPNGDKDQQFKDSAIWESILSLLDSYIIYFVTDDKHFFKGRNSSEEKLADNLSEDCEQHGGIVYIRNSMKSCLTSLQKDVPPINYSDIILKIDDIINIRLRTELATEIGFEITSLATDMSVISAFLIEKKDNLALSFEICYQCIDIQSNDNNERKDGIFKVKGSCLYKFNTQIISDIKIDFERIYWIEPNGELGSRRVIYASTFIGNTQRINYSLMEPFDFIRSPETDWANRKTRKHNDLEKFFKEYGDNREKILRIFLDQYTKEGIIVFHQNINSLNRYPEFAQYGNVNQILKLFNGQEELEKILNQLKDILY